MKKRIWTRVLGTSLNWTSWASQPQVMTERHFASLLLSPFTVWTRNITIKFSVTYIFSSCDLNAIKQFTDAWFVENQSFEFMQRGKVVRHILVYCNFICLSISKKTRKSPRNWHGSTLGIDCISFLPAPFQSNLAFFVMNSLKCTLLLLAVFVVSSVTAQCSICDYNGDGSIPCGLGGIELFYFTNNGFNAYTFECPSSALNCEFTIGAKTFTGTLSVETNVTSTETRVPELSVENVACMPVTTHTVAPSTYSVTISTESSTRLQAAAHLAIKINYASNPNSAESIKVPQLAALLGAFVAAIVALVGSF